MHTTETAVFLSLLIAHLAADFLLQPDRLREGKRRMIGRAYLQHSAAHFLCTLLALLPFSASLPLVLLPVAAAALAGFHALSDWLRHRAARHWNSYGPSGFLVDQASHLAAIAAVTCWLAPGARQSWQPALAHFLAHRNTALLVLVIYLAAIFGGAPFVRSCTRHLLSQFSRLEDQGASSFRHLKHAGMYIGWLERFLVLTAMVLHSPATIGLILTAKAIVRFPEMKDLRFAEYFLIGTLLSLSIALAGGILLLAIVHGRITLD